MEISRPFPLMALVVLGNYMIAWTAFGTAS